MIDYNAISYRRTFQGAIEFSIMHNGMRVTKQYMGYDEDFDDEEALIDYLQDRFIQDLE